MAFDLERFLHGMGIGAVGQPQPLDLSRAGCRMCRYNGWVLPALPEKRYGYRTILRYSGEEIRLMDSDTPLQYTGVYWRPESSPVAYVRYTNRGGRWELTESVTGGTNVGVMATWECLWADYDVKDAAGNVVCGASEIVEMGG